MILVPKNWAEFQHYKDRAPPWVKLHKGLLDDSKFQRLPVASRALAPMLWLLASESPEGHFDGSYSELGFRLRQTEKEIEAALKPLISNGFFSVVQDASNTLAERKQDACLETEERQRESKRQRTEAEAPDGVSPQVWIDFQSHRKTIKAPLTLTALDGIAREAAKAGLTLEAALRESMARGWRGFKAEWMQTKGGETAYQKNMREKMQALVPAIAAKAPMNPNAFIDAIEITPLEISHGNQ